MNTHQDHDFTEPELDERSVATYLRRHPEFFHNHPSVAAQLQIPHHCGSAVSLIEYQVNMLREQNQQMKHKLKELVQVGRENDRLGERMLQLTLALLDATSLDGLLTALDDILHHDFKADAVAVRLFDPDGALGGRWPDKVMDPKDPELIMFQGFFRANRPLCGHLKAEQLELLFGAAAEGVGSAALIGLGEYAELGMLAIGSREPNRFHPGMGTLFLSRMGTLIGCALGRYLTPRDDG
ncbi:MAG: DUF484 family protein [Gammaproteobacteria bacterium]|nr:DUF484 family protein [Gammaproteobacteria bacterium]NIR98679.1 DUF484 family protein [Gammaproteobacteria bacterium]NIT64391.1 DUF484 family protein [Gammaproteobacteria bacterium]NIV19490.1 DUF484 family protein [Gammaproteobacteria bacterium]NIY32971.1 DUF484 family protein [Gammaproteobacteria bacterium]